MPNWDGTGLRCEVGTARTLKEPGEQAQLVIFQGSKFTAVLNPITSKKEPFKIVTVTEDPFEEIEHAWEATTYVFKGFNSADSVWEVQYPIEAKPIPNTKINNLPSRDLLLSEPRSIVAAPMAQSVQPTAEPPSRLAPKVAGSCCK